MQHFNEDILNDCDKWNNMHIFKYKTKAPSRVAASLRLNEWVESFIQPIHSKIIIPLTKQASRDCMYEWVA